MTIIRSGEKIELTADEISLAHREFVTDWMAEALQNDFGLSVKDSCEYADIAYDIYCEGDGLTEYEAVQKAAEKCETDKNI